MYIGAGVAYDDTNNDERDTMYTNTCIIDPSEIEHDEDYLAWIDAAGVPDSDEAAAAWVTHEVERMKDAFEAYMEARAEERKMARMGY